MPPGVSKAQVPTYLRQCVTQHCPRTHSGNAGTSVLPCWYRLPSWPFSSFYNSCNFSPTAAVRASEGLAERLEMAVAERDNEALRAAAAEAEAESLKAKVADANARAAEARRAAAPGAAEAEAERRASAAAHEQLRRQLAAQVISLSPSFGIINLLEWFRGNPSALSKPSLSQPHPKP